MSLLVGLDGKKWRLRFCGVLALLVILSGSRKPLSSEIGWLLALEVVNSETGDLTADVGVQCTTGKPAFLAVAAEGRADVRARCAVNLDAARRVKDQSVAKARLHEMAMGGRTRDTKRLTSAEVSRQGSFGSCRVDNS